MHAGPKKRGKKFTEKLLHMPDLCYGPEIMIKHTTPEYFDQNTFFQTSTVSILNHPIILSKCHDHADKNGLPFLTRVQYSPIRFHETLHLQLLAMMKNLPVLILPGLMSPYFV